MGVSRAASARRESRPRICHSRVLAAWRTASVTGNIIMRGRATEPIQAWARASSAASDSSTLRMCWTNIVVSLRPKKAPCSVNASRVPPPSGRSSTVASEVDEAWEWFNVLPAAMGIEGMVAKCTASRYLPGVSGWLKVKHRDTVEIIVGAVTVTLNRPEVVIAGRYRAVQLVQVGRVSA